MNERSTALQIVEDIYLSQAQDEAAYNVDGYLISDEAPTPDLDALCAFRNYVDDVGRAARLAKKIIEERISEELGEGGSYRYGDQFIRASGSPKYKVTAPDELVAFAGDDFPKLVNVVNSVKIGALKSLLKERGHDEDFIDTFGEYVEDDKPLSVMPIDKAPKWAQKLEPGARSFPKGKTLEEAAAATTEPVTG